MIHKVYLDARHRQKVENNVKLGKKNYMMDIVLDIL